MSKTDTHSKITCITLQETWFDENTPLDSYCIPGYTLISEPHRITSHGGVAIYLNNKFSYRKPELNHDSNVYENLTIEIWQEDLASSKYLISSIYRPPTHSVEDFKSFTNEFSIFLKIIHRRHRKGYINGDFNINFNTLTNYYENTHTSGVLSMPISDQQMTFTTLVGTTLQATNK